MNESDPTVVQLLKEINQSPDLRQGLIGELESHFANRCVLVYFTSFNQPVIIENADADMIEGILQKCDLSGGLSMVINSPGGDALAAERIINVCRSYSGGDFEVIVPKMAKSAATMICLGANRIWMSQTSELGPIDPQVFREEQRVTSAHSIITSYEELLQQAVYTTQGNIDPYLQQLARYDATEIKDLRTAQQLAVSIAVDALQKSMMQGMSEAEVRDRIKPFIDPSITSSHGRRISLETARDSGLRTEEISLREKRWNLLWELFIRADYYVTIKASKVVETKEHHFETPRVG